MSDPAYTEDKCNKHWHFQAATASGKEEKCWKQQKREKTGPNTLTLLVPKSIEKYNSHLV